MSKKEEALAALQEIELEAEMAKTHDIGQLGSMRLADAAMVLRRLLWGVICVVLALWCASCGKRESPAGGGDLVAHPGVSQAVIERTRQQLAVAPTVVATLPTRRPTAVAVAAVVPVRRALVPPPPLVLPPPLPTPPPWDCQAYARTLLPWRGPPISPVFAAVGEATLPDTPEFADRRTVACALLREYAGL